VGSVVGAIICGIVGSEVGEWVFETAEEGLERILVTQRESLEV